jgi:hypothetical protein
MRLYASREPEELHGSSLSQRHTRSTEEIVRLRSLLVCATALAATSAMLCTAPALHADSTDSPITPSNADSTDSPITPSKADAAGPAINPVLIKEIQSGTRVRSIIQVKPGQSVDAVAGDIEQASEGSRVLESAKSPNFFVAEVDQPTLAKLQQDVRVQSVYKDELHPPTLAPAPS